jgi:predicted NAD-dependent protein-ADP-ribosyltransferase YbiA (DUF1768 family)
MGGTAYVDGIAYPEFDNSHIRKFIGPDGLTWHTTEGYYQANKFAPSEEKHREHIRRYSADAHQCWTLGQSREHKLIPGFEEAKYGIMLDANRAKFQSNGDLAILLISTAPSDIVCRGSTSWWNDANGRILMQVRGELAGA